MPRYGDRSSPRGGPRRWEVVLADEERGRPAPALRALDVRAQHRILQDLAQEDLARVPLLGEGERLVRYGEYLDLHDPARAGFTAEGTEVVRPGQRVVARVAVEAAIWDRLIEAAHDLVGWRRRKTA